MDNSFVVDEQTLDSSGVRTSTRKPCASLPKPAVIALQRAGNDPKSTALTMPYLAATTIAETPTRVRFFMDSPLPGLSACECPLASRPNRQYLTKFVTAADSPKAPLHRPRQSGQDQGTARHTHNRPLLADKYIEQVRIDIPPFSLNRPRICSDSVRVLPFLYGRSLAVKASKISRDAHDARLDGHLIRLNPRG